MLEIVIRQCQGPAESGEKKLFKNSNHSLSYVIKSHKRKEMGVAYMFRVVEPS